MGMVLKAFYLYCCSFFFSLRFVCFPSQSMESLKLLRQKLERALNETFFNGKKMEMNEFKVAFDAVVVVIGGVIRYTLFTSCATKNNCQNGQMNMKCMNHSSLCVCVQYSPMWIERKRKKKNKRNRKEKSRHGITSFSYRFTHIKHEN